MKRTNQDLADSAYFWGIAKTYRYGAAVRATSWKDVDEKMKARLERDMKKLAQTIRRRDKKSSTGIKNKSLFLFSLQDSSSGLAGGRLCLLA